MSVLIDRFAVALANSMIRYRWLVIAAAIAGVVAIGNGLGKLEFSTNYRIFFSDENPELMAFESFQDTYTKNDNIVFVLKPADGKVFTPQLTDAMERLTELAWQIPYVIRVDSLSNFQYTWSEDDDLIVEDLISGGLELSAEELAAKQQVALAEPLLLHNLISEDAGTAGISATLQFSGENIKEVPEAVVVARDIADQFRAEFPDLTIALSGVTMLNNAFGETGQRDAGTLTPLMYLILLVAMVLVLRSVSAMLATLVVILFSTVIAMGLAGFAGIKLTPISVTAPTIILTLAIADSVHILVSMFAAMGEGRDKIAALKESIRINLMPVTVTSLTTVVGFLSLNFSDTPPFWHLGNITAMGITAAWLLSLTLLPAVISLLPVKRRLGGSNNKLNLGITRLADWVTHRYKTILWVMGPATVLLVAMIPTIQLNDEFVKYFDERVEFRNDADFANAHLNGPYVVELSVESGEPGGVSDPDYLKNLERLADWLAAQPEVNHVYSYTDIVKRLNKNLHGDDPSWHRIPDNRQLAAQYLLLYEMSLPYGLDLNDRINVDKSATRVTAALKDMSTIEIRAFLDRSKAWMADNLPPQMQAKPTSATVMFSYISQRNIESMFKGNTVAIFAIGIILMFALRSFRLGALSLIPNTVPIMMTFGIWALLVGKVGMAAATITATSMGIVVDDTVHFLSKYLRARREKGLAIPDAIRYAFQTVGVAILATTIILVIGFGVLMYSSFLINFQMGLLTAITIVSALVFDFLMLPALLMLGHKKKSAEPAAQQALS
ncbi:MMPL family transporter [Porticoccus sp. W117]|uniref:efflux RND transporter permease subunit n=1 Tax=Porticoccus sp. W117 TaxID=3054777 RepID=UPI002598B0C8|nr:MMPL family transporter [Porticoccus sp. W117]MDM3870835.1 MMPL family transporter [Porticoccus sp. W117]